MIDPQIEFFLSDSDDDAVAEPAAAHLTAVSVGRLGGPSALWLAAAGLLVIAPFRLVYALGVRFSEVHQTTTEDGWGRVRRSVTGTSMSDHGPRYGIVLSVAAGLLVVAATSAALASVRRSGRLRVASGGLGLVGAALAAGVAAAALLDVQSLRDTIRGELRVPADDAGFSGTRDRPIVHLTTGWMVWLTAIAVCCAFGAVLLLALPQPHAIPRAERPVSFAPTVEPELHPQDEVLDTRNPGRRSLF